MVECLGDESDNVVALAFFCFQHTTNGIPLPKICVSIWADVYALYDMYKVAAIATFLNGLTTVSEIKLSTGTVEWW